MKLEAERAKTAAKKKGGAAALRAAQSAVGDQDAPTPAATVVPETPKSKSNVWIDVPPSRSASRISKSRAVSPASSSSSASDPPLAEKMKMSANSAKAEALPVVSPVKAESAPPPPVVPPTSDSPPVAPPSHESVSAPPPAPLSSTGVSTPVEQTNGVAVSTSHVRAEGA